MGSDRDTFEAPPWEGHPTLLLHCATGTTQGATCTDFPSYFDQTVLWGELFLQNSYVEVLKSVTVFGGKVFKDMIELK